MPQLKQMQCKACESDSSGIGDMEAAELQSQVSEWKLISLDDGKRLERDFQFEDFAKALAFTQQVGAVAERENHHPSLLTEWGRVRVRWWTHKIKGLHYNDFIMAARTDELFNARRTDA